MAKRGGVDEWLAPQLRQRLGIQRDRPQWCGQMCGDFRHGNAVFEIDMMTRPHDDDTAEFLTLDKLYAMRGDQTGILIAGVGLNQRANIGQQFGLGRIKIARQLGL